MWPLSGKSKEDKAREAADAAADARWQAARDAGVAEQEANLKKWSAGVIGQEPADPEVEARRASLVNAIRNAEIAASQGNFEEAKRAIEHKVAFKKALAALGPAPTRLRTSAEKEASAARVARGQAVPGIPRPTFPGSLKEAAIGGGQGLVQGVLGAGDTFSMGILPAVIPGYKETQADLREKNSGLSGHMWLPSSETMGNISGGALSMAGGPARAVAKGVTAGVERGAAGLLGQLERRIPALVKQVRPSVRTAAKNILGQGVAGGFIQGGLDAGVRGNNVLEGGQAGAALGGPLVAAGALAAPVVRKGAEAAGYVRDLIRRENPSIPILEDFGATFGVGTIKNGPTSVQGGPPEPGLPPLPPHRATAEHRGRLAMRTEDVIKRDAEMGKAAGGRRLEKDLDTSLGEEGDWQASMEEIAARVDEAVGQPSVNSKHPLARLQKILNGSLEATEKLRVTEPVGGTWDDVVIPEVDVGAGARRRFNMSTGSMESPARPSMRKGPRDVESLIMKRSGFDVPVDLEADVSLKGSARDVPAPPPVPERSPRPPSGQSELFAAAGKINAPKGVQILRMEEAAQREADAMASLPARPEQDALLRAAGRIDRPTTTGPEPSPPPPPTAPRETPVTVGATEFIPATMDPPMRPGDLGPTSANPTASTGRSRSVTVPMGVQREVKVPGGGLTRENVGDIHGRVGEGPNRVLDIRNINRLRDELDQESKLWAKATGGDPKTSIYGELAEKFRETVRTHAPKTGAANLSHSERLAAYEEGMKDLKSEGEGSFGQQLLTYGKGGGSAGINHDRMTRVRDKFPVTAESDLGPELDELYPGGSRLTRENLKGQMDIQAPLAAQEKLKLKATINPSTLFDREGPWMARVGYPLAGKSARGAGALADALELKPAQPSPSSSPRFTGARGAFDAAVSPYLNRPGGAPWLPGIEDAVAQAYEQLNQNPGHFREAAERRATTGMHGDPTLREAVRQAYDELLLAPLSRF